MTTIKLILCGSVMAVSMLMSLQIGLTSASAQRGCKMGGDCNYSASGTTTNKDEGP